MANNSASLTATGSVTLTGKPKGDTLTLVQISGTYGTVQFVLEGTFDGTNYDALVAIRSDTGAVVTGTISPSDNATQAWKVPSEGYSAVRARVTAIASGTVTFTLDSGVYLGLPFTASSATAGATSTLTAGIAFNGATTANALTIPDNLADALNVKEGSNSYLKFVTTDSGEKLVLGKVFDAPAGFNATGATTANVISLTDNLADALSVKESTNSYLKFITTDAAETVVIGKPLTTSIGGSTAAAGSTTTDATVLPASTAFVYPTTAADDTKGVRIDVADKVTGRAFYVGNGVSNKILKVYAPSGGAINGAAGDAAYSTASGKGALVVCLNSAGNTWFAIG